METNPAFQKLIDKKKKSGNKLSPNQMKAHESVMSDLSNVLSETGAGKLKSSKNPKQANPKAETAEDAVKNAGGKHVAESGGSSTEGGEEPTHEASEESTEEGVETEFEEDSEETSEESEEGMYSDSSDAPKSREQMQAEIDSLKAQLASRG